MIYADFHIHSCYAAACSKDITLAKLEQYARLKGLNIIGTGDFQHPKWNQTLKEELQEDDNGILWSRNKFPFIWQTELSLAYTQDGKGRRIHLVTLVPNREVADQFVEWIKSKGRIDYDGRPIFGMSGIEYTEQLMSISKDIEIIPAHAWTSWFGVLGSKSGFDSVEACFKEKSKYIHAIETGMSSDPGMNWRIPSLDKYQLVSFSDIHSFWPWRFGREATVFDTELTYKAIIQAIRTGERLQNTIETPPTYGKYHVDGHRACGITMTYDQTKKLNGICPKCKSEMTIGVEYRVEELADPKRPIGYQRPGAKPYHSLLPLTELIAAIYDIKQLASKRVWEIYNLLLAKFGTEYYILLEATHEQLSEVVHPKLADLILANRNNKLTIIPGYDGVYGQVVLTKEQLLRESKQKKLLDF
ncbi:MAG: endonuclease Q family protein [Nanoarchaeota archaeon]|nr:endonuclease Q family protein [Nanoarchaeota archaeon]